MEQKKILWISKATEPIGNTRLQDGNNEATIYNSKHVNNVNQSKRPPYDTAP